MGQRITRADVAKNAGVSESTVSRALADSPRISGAIKLKVKDVADHLGYIPNRQAAHLARNKTFRLALVVRRYRSFTPFSRSYFPRLLDGTLQRAEERGYSVTILLDRDRDRDRFKDLSLPVLGREVDGLIFSITPVEDPRFADLKARSVPFVLVNNRMEGHHCVDCDAESGMRDAFSHAKALGHGKIGYITGDPDYWDGRSRYSTFLRLAREFSMETMVESGDFSKTRGREAAETLLRSADPPTLIMCASDRSALGVLGYCREKGIRVPEELSVIGFDNLGPAGDSIPALTTVHHPVDRMGGEAVDMLIDLLEGRPSEPVRTVRTGLVIRNTTGCPR